MKTPKIETNRLLLRPLTLEDSSAIQKHFNNWNIVKQIGAEVPWPCPNDGAITYLKAMLNTVETTETYLWGIVIKGVTTEVFGVVEYRLSDDEDDNRGFWLAEPYWGCGYMTEAIVATQDYVFLELDTTRLIVMGAESNEGSRKVKMRCGAQLIDRVPSEYLTGDEWQEVWEVTRDKWISIRESESLAKY